MSVYNPFNEMVYKGFEESDTEVIRIYSVYSETALDYIPPHLSTDPLGPGWHDRSKYRLSRNGGPFAEIRLTYSKNPLENENLAAELANQEVGTNTYDIRFNWIQKTLETHGNYECRWNHDLYVFCIQLTPAKIVGTTITLATYQDIPAPPEFWKTAKALNAADGLTNGRRWQFDKARPAPETIGDIHGIWKMVKARTMPGIEYYPHAQAVIVRKVVCADRRQAMKLCINGGLLEAPPVTYGYGEGNKYWRKMPQGIDTSGKNYVLTINYERASGGWDGRLHPGGVPWTEA